jgi:hypothetical protein
VQTSAFIGDSIKAMTVFLEVAHRCAQRVMPSQLFTLLNLCCKLVLILATANVAQGDECVDRKQKKRWLDQLEKVRVVSTRGRIASALSCPSLVGLLLTTLETGVLTLWDADFSGEARAKVVLKVVGKVASGLIQCEIGDLVKGLCQGGKMAIAEYRRQCAEICFQQLAPFLEVIQRLHALSYTNFTHNAHGFLTVHSYQHHVYHQIRFCSHS